MVGNNTPVNVANLVCGVLWAIIFSFFSVKAMKHDMPRMRFLFLSMMNGLEEEKEDFKGDFASTET